MSIEDFLTIRQTEVVLGKCERTIRDLIKSGALPAIKDGKRWLLKRTDVESYFSNLATM